MRHRLAAASFAGSMLAAPTMACAADQPHMYAALHDLQHAMWEIQQADQYRDHGGYAGAATGDINDAIQNVQAGIAYRDSHGP